MTIPHEPNGSIIDHNHEQVQRGIPEWAKDGLSIESKECLDRLVAYTAPPLPDFGVVKLAAVLVGLFQKPGDDKLHVILTTRAKTLRRHPSQTALPGGKVDPEDADAMHTARREAYEEVGLPLSHRDIHYLTTIDPVMTILPLNAHMKNHIVVIPVVYLISDPSIVDDLTPNPDEVDAIFTHPLVGCLNGHLESKDSVGLVEKGGEWWPHQEDFHSTEDRIGTTGGYRMHRFRTVRSPIKGLTSDVLIHCASIAYGIPPRFERFAPSQPPFSSVIDVVIAELPSVLETPTVSEGSSSLNGNGERKVLEWGGTEAGKRVFSTELYEVV